MSMAYNTAFKVLTDQRAALVALARDLHTPKKLALRCHIVLSCSEGHPPEHVGGELGVSSQTVRKWQKRYRQAGIAGLSDRPRSGRPPRVSAQMVEHLIRQILDRPLCGGKRWSVRTVAEEVKLSPAMIGRAWKKAGIAGRRLHHANRDMDGHCR
jgi:transposase